MKPGTKILLIDWPEPFVVVSWPEDETDPHAEVVLKTPGRWGGIMTCELGHLQNGRVKYVEVQKET